MCKTRPPTKYRAWYKAFTGIESDSYRIGKLVSPKTVPGDYIIQKSGDITVYAGESVVLKPGFHAQNGSNFHAFIKQDCKQPLENVPEYGYIPKTENNNFNKIQLAYEVQNQEVIKEKKTELVEPLYLGLQNQRLGSQAKSTDIYKAERRAKHHITVGRLVTPTTDPGDYIVESNADLNLRAGDRIHFKPGTHFKAGSKVHAKIEYWPCHRKIQIMPFPDGFEGGSIVMPENNSIEFGELAHNICNLTRIEENSSEAKCAQNEPINKSIPKLRNEEDKAIKVSRFAIRED